MSSAPLGYSTTDRLIALCMGSHPVVTSVRARPGHMHRRRVSCYGGKLATYYRRTYGGRPGMDDRFPVVGWLLVDSTLFRLST